MTTPRPASDLVGLVYSMTPRPGTSDLAWHKRPVVLAVIVLIMTLGLNLYFR